MTTPSTMKPGAVALVTGASSGIGKAIADSLLDRGLRVVCIARNLERLNASFACRGESALALSLDVTDGDAVAGLLERLPENWRGIDVLVANAGSDVGGRRRFDEGDVEDWTSTVETNVNGVIRVCYSVIPGMLAREQGHIVVLGSIAGLFTYPGASIYAATKHAVHAFTSGLHHDYKTQPIRITEIMPGMVRTGFATARHFGDDEKATAFYDDWPATLDADDIAACVLFALDQPEHVNISQVVVTPTGDK